MDFNKLKLDKFESFGGYNLPQGFTPPLELDMNPDVYFMFVSSIEETMNAINVIQNKTLPKENRVFFVFKKGIKEFGRDHVYNLVMQSGNFKRKAPMLASLDKTYSVFCFMYEN